MVEDLVVLNLDLTYSDPFKATRLVKGGIEKVPPPITHAQVPILMALDSITTKECLLKLFLLSPSTHFLVWDNLKAEPEAGVLGAGVLFGR